MTPMPLMAALPVADSYTLTAIGLAMSVAIVSVAGACLAAYGAIKSRTPAPELILMSALSGVLALVAGYTGVWSWQGRASALATSETSLVFIAERINDAHPGLIPEVDQPGLARILHCAAEPAAMVVCEYTIAGDASVDGWVQLRVNIAE